MELRQQVSKQIIQLSLILSRSENMDCKEKVLQRLTDHLAGPIEDAESEIRAEKKRDSDDSEEALRDYQNDQLLINDYQRGEL